MRRTIFFNKLDKLFKFNVLGGQKGRLHQLMLETGTHPGLPVNYIFAYVNSVMN
ncbi:hypothetical protein HanIR_Chr02g0061771 [Helianthus annuus]|nr:hypothetical protein HanIR_Chr02g0061771 [Helianthus annuus]